MIVGLIVGLAVFSYLIIGLLTARWFVGYEKQRWPNLEPDKIMTGVVFLLWPFVAIPLLFALVGKVVLAVIGR